MNQTLPLPDIARLLARAADVDSDTALKFVRDFFEVITEGLAAGEAVHVKGLGTFKASTDSERAVDFIPDDDFRSAINAPFEAFEPIEVPADITVTEIEQLVEIDDSLPEAEPVTKAESVPETEAESETDVEIAQVPVETEVTSTDDAVAEDVNESIEEQGSMPDGQEPAVTQEIEEPEETYEPASTDETEVDPADVTESSITESDDSSSVTDIEDAPVTKTETPPVAQRDAVSARSVMVVDDDDEQVYFIPNRRRSRRKMIMWIIAALLVGFIIGSICVYVRYDNMIRGLVEQSYQTNKVIPAPDDGTAEVDVEVAVIDTVSPDTADTTHQEIMAPVESAPESSEPVYDTISTKRFLATMARQHYGEKEFWVYIYQANASKLRHPDRIKPGTRVLIPDYKTLPLTGNHAADVSAAQRLGQEIYARYQ